ncbi:MAG: pseudouridine synthase [Variovorax sp.]|nr:pseudouridine synthase [Variovorax sp.]
MSRPPPPSRLPLPTRDGVGASCVALSAGPWPTITDFLVQRFPAVSRADWLARMGAGDVVDEHGVPVTEARRYQSPLRVYYYRALDAETPVPFDEVILFQDAHLLVVDKPHFLPVTPSGKYLQQSLLVRLKRRLGIEALVPIHRIDRETAGLVLFSVQAATRGAYQQLFAERAVTKHYEAVVAWREGLALPAVHRSRLVDDEECFLRMREVPGEANSETRLQLVEARGDRARLRLSPVTGRRHQLRVQCAALGVPIVNDQIYPRLLPPGSDDHARPLQLLAKSLAFTDPLSGDARRFESPRNLPTLAPVPSSP